MKIIYKRCCLLNKRCYICTQITTKKNKVMETILLEFPKGLRQRVSSVLNCISEKTTESTDKNKTIVEFIGTLNNPVALLHTLDASLFEHITILSKY